MIKILTEIILIFITYLAILTIISPKIKLKNQILKELIFFCKIKIFYFEPTKVNVSFHTQLSK